MTARLVTAERLNAAPLARQILLAYPDARESDTGRRRADDPLGITVAYAERFGLSRRQAHRDLRDVWAGTVAFYTADRLATFLGLHLALLWPELYRDGADDGALDVEVGA